MNRIVNILFSIDCTLFTIATLGKAYPYESFSSAAYRGEKYGKFYGKARPIIDWLFAKLLGQTDHCRIAYEESKFNLPEDMR
jgi:hypothetical protein